MFASSYFAQYLQRPVNRGDPLRENVGAYKYIEEILNSYDWGFGVLGRDRETDPRDKE